jgi:hypothetical protein
MPGGPEIEALKALASHSQSWADWSTFIVFLGLLGEIGITFAYTKDKPRAEIIWGVICGVVIAVGVYGEYKFGSKAAGANSQLQRISDTKVAALNVEAEEARRASSEAESHLADAKASSALAEAHAKEADARAADANAKAEGFRFQIADATKRAAEAGEKSEGFRLQIAQANERAANAQARFLELQSELLPRRITPSQKSEFLRALGSVKGIPKVSIWADITVSDRTDFGHDLRDLFKSAGIEAEFSDAPAISPELPDEKARGLAAACGMAFEIKTEDAQSITPLVTALFSSKIALSTVPVLTSPTFRGVGLRITSREIQQTQETPDR